MYIYIYTNILRHLFYLHSVYIMHCIVLYCIVLYCIVLYCIVLYCIVLYCIVLYCTVLYWKNVAINLFQWVSTLNYIYIAPYINSFHYMTPFVSLLSLHTGVIVRRTPPPGSIQDSLWTEPRTTTLNKAQQGSSPVSSSGTSGTVIINLNVNDL